VGRAPLLAGRGRERKDIALGGTPRAVAVFTMSTQPTRSALRSEIHEDRVSLHQGAVIAGAYVVDRVLGVGGMGTVVAARTIETGEVVAIKFMLPHFAEHKQLLIRFQREARATERVQSRHVRHVIYAGAVSERMPYIVMEYLDGEDLRSLVRREGPLEPRQAASYVNQACHGLAEAHALGIVHRDLKPANLFLARRPDGPSIIKVLDFGVAKFDSPNVSGDTMEVTEIAALVGSRYYMAPEQITNSQGVNALADVWALGAILHYLLTGSTPFAAQTAEEVIVNVLREPPHPLDELRPDVPFGLVSIVKRCLQKNPANRYANVSDLARALIPFMKAQDEETVPSTRYPKEFTRTLRLSKWPIPLRPSLSAESTDEPVTTPMKPLKAAPATKEDRSELETEPDAVSATVIGPSKRQEPARAKEVEAELVEAESVEEAEVVDAAGVESSTEAAVTEPLAAEPEATVTPPRSSAAPTLFLARPRHPRGVVIGWIASAIVGGLIAVAVGRPPAVQATTTVASAMPATAHEAVTTPVVIAATAPEKAGDDAGLVLTTQELPDVVAAPVKAPSLASAAARPSVRGPGSAVDPRAPAIEDFSREPLFKMPVAAERR
jgi:serine/threonine-protein kinase